jgi:hypothetical protein
MNPCNHETPHATCSSCASERFRAAKNSIDNYCRQIKHLRAIEYMTIDAFVHNCYQLVAVGRYLEHTGEKEDHSIFATRRAIVKAYICTKIKDYIDEKL